MYVVWIAESEDSNNNNNLIILWGKKSEKIFFLKKTFTRGEKILSKRQQSQTE